MVVDHINRNGLDNRKSNLRHATYSQNSWNQIKVYHPAYSSKFKGVSKNDSGKWVAHIATYRVSHYIGTFKTEIEAALAYDEKALQLHGEFAKINFPEKIKKEVVNS